MRTLNLAIPFLFVSLIFLSPTAAAQFLPASAPIADPADTRFEGVKEDWTTPSLTNSTLKQMQPIVGYTSEYPGYAVQLIRLQWRFGDPIDLYVMKPKGITKPPVIIYLYGYPAGTDRFKDEGFQSSVTKDGFAAVGFVSALTGAVITTARCGSGSSVNCKSLWRNRLTMCSWCSITLL